MTSTPSRFQRFLGLFHLSRDPNIPRLDGELVRQFWFLTGLYWLRPGAWASWLTLLIITLWTFGTTEFSAYVVKLGGDRLNALSGKNEATYFTLLWQGALISQGLNLSRLIFDLPERLLNLHWKRWMTRHFISCYLGNLSYYRINRDQTVDNPDERIANDIQAFVSFPMTLQLSVLATH